MTDRLQNLLDWLDNEIARYEKLRGEDCLATFSYHHDNGIVQGLNKARNQVRFMVADNAEKTFKLHWRDGKTEIVKGSGITEAVSAMGYGAGAVAALDGYEEIKEDSDEC